MDFQLRLSELINILNVSWFWFLNIDGYNPHKENLFRVFNNFQEY